MNNGLQEQELELETALPELGSHGELEQEWELEGGSESEFESEFEQEGESEQEQFFGQLARLAARAQGSPALRRIGASAARAALQSLRDGLGETEFEAESEAGRDGLYSPIRRAYPDAVMEHMAHQASMAESEQEAAEAFLPLIPMLAAKLAPMAIRALPGIGRAAARLAPRMMQGVMRVAPQLTRGIGNITRTLYRNPQMRGLVRMIPAIARGTTAQLARRIARGGTVTPQIALRALAGQTARTLGSPQRCVHAYRRGRRLDRLAHRVVPAVAAPVQRTRPRRYAVCGACGR